MRCLAVFSLLLMLAQNLTGATEYFVRVDGNDANSGLSWATAKASIQAAVDAATDGDTVSVSNWTATRDLSTAAWERAATSVESAVAVGAYETESPCGTMVLLR